MENQPTGFILQDNPGLTARALIGPLIADAPIGLALLDTKFRYVFINETQAGFNELPVPEHIGKTVREVLGDASWEQLASSFQHSLSGDLLRSLEISLNSVRQPGTLRHYLISFYPVRSDRRTVTGVGTVVSDITERKQNEALIAGQNLILEGIATDIPLEQTLTSLARLIEEQLPNCPVIVLQSDTESRRLSVSAAPGLTSEAASRLWERLETTLSTAAGEGRGWSQESITCSLPQGALAPESPELLPGNCWLTPILGEKDEILGALGILLPEIREPSPRERSLVDSAVHTARIAMERDRELVRRRHLLRDMLSSLTEGRLVLCLSPEDLPAPLDSPSGETTVLSKEVLRDLRHRVTGISEQMNMSDERRYDLEVAVGEASMNAVVHAGTGTADVFVDADRSRIQVWIRDAGTGIAEESLHRATLERGFSTGGTLGHGFFMILNTIDKAFLLTGPEGTTIVLEHSAQSAEPDWMSLI